MGIVLVEYGILAIGLAFLLYASNAHIAFKALVLSCLLFLGVSAYDVYQENIGAPANGRPPAEFLYVHHEIGNGEITLWVYEEGRGQRLYLFDYDQETAQKLEEAKKSKSKGFEKKGEFVQQTEGDRTFSGLVLDDWRGANDEREK